MRKRPRRSQPPRHCLQKPIIGFVGQQPLPLPLYLLLPTKYSLSLYFFTYFYPQNKIKINVNHSSKFVMKYYSEHHVIVIYGKYIG